MNNNLSVELAERGWVPEPLLRLGIRRLVHKRLQDETQKFKEPEARWREWLEWMDRSPVALAPEAANQQHYMVPPAFYEAVLGPHLKYSSGYWPQGIGSLEASEEAMLRLTCERAGIIGRQKILELGCGWGSLTLWMAEHFPFSEITAVSHSPWQKEFIEKELRARSLSNVTVITEDMNDFQARGKYDRVVSVEMFEHMRNWTKLLTRIKGWLLPDGRVFLHVFAHRQYPYAFENEAGDDWMARHFFSGGIMPSVNMLEKLPIPLAIENSWVLPGTHYAKTAEAWYKNLVKRRAELEALFRKHLTPPEAKRQVERWKMFFLSCAELFGYADGREWVVAHYRLSPKE